MARIFVIIASLVCSLCASAQVSPAFSDDLYLKALWMSTRFYGAQRSGFGPNWLIAEHSASFSGYEGGKSFSKDADGSYDLSGGWFDCGDFAKFGQTQFYACYLLLLGYSEFPSGYPDLYSADFHGYVKAKDYSFESAKGVPNGIPDVLDECKYATDFFLKCIAAKNKFYYQVGNGNYDHQQWNTSVFRSANVNVVNGGEADGSRPVFSVSQGATSMVALCGASLAAMSRLYAPFDADYAQSCLSKAKLCAEFVENGSKYNIADAQGSAEFYPAKPDYFADLVILYSELYLASQSGSYKSLAESYFAQMPSDHGYSICYNNTNDLADYLLFKVSASSTALAQLKKYAEAYQGSNYLLNVRGDATWGALRYCAAQAFVHALYSKAVNASSVDPYTLRTVDFILGDNDNKFSYVTGFGDNYPVYPHFRNVYQNDQNVMSSCLLPSKFAQLGLMIGGYRDNSVYPNNDVNDYTRGEGGIDYNAGLVGALGYLNSFFNAQTASSRHVCSKAGVSFDGHYVSVDSPSPVSIEVYSLTGLQVLKCQSCNSLSLDNLPSGIYVVKAGIAVSRVTKR